MECRTKVLKINTSVCSNDDAIVDRWCVARLRLYLHYPLDFIRL